ncbi:MAG TPA: class I SAM-dependent methyltransferase [Candidatus Eremiobacteraceae bacterium]|nr:class I SAM-dependent methyltransferase [Candidatus Eremiobacteraceae bacterium]
MSSSARKDAVGRRGHGSASHALYENPRLYDLGFGFRNIARECDGLLAIAAKHGTSAPRRIVDIACGPAHHLREYARRGLVALGVDVNAEMIEYARHLNKQAHVAVGLRKADMRRFHLPTRVDIAQCLFDSFSHCVTDADAVATLRRAAAALRPGGLLILELTHPADYFGGDEVRTVGRWVQRYDDVAVKTRFQTTAIDAVEETYVKSMVIDAVYKVGKKKKRIVDRQLHRMWLRGGIRNVVAQSGAFEIVGWYGDLTPKVPLSMRPASWRMVVAMRRRKSRS